LPSCIYGSSLYTAISHTHVRNDEPWRINNNNDKNNATANVVVTSRYSLDGSNHET